MKVLRKNNKDFLSSGDIVSQHRRSRQPNKISRESMLTWNTAVLPLNPLVTTVFPQNEEFKIISKKARKGVKTAKVSKE